MPKKQKTIGLALGGGGARGCAHVGVIRALEEAGIPIDYIAGTSVGAMVGGVYAAGGIKKLEDYLNKMKLSDVAKNFDPVMPRQGFFKGEKICKMLEDFMSTNDFRKIPIPFIAVATNLSTGREVHLNKGKITDSIMGSIALPGIFVPVKKGGQYLVDGGVVNPVPVNVVRKMGADIVIAVDLNYEFIREKIKSKHRDKTDNALLSGWFKPKYPNIIDVIENSFFVMQNYITQKNLEIYKPDFLITLKLGLTTYFDFHKAKKLMDEGYRQTKRQIPAIKKLLNR
jgi:NTE family protein